MGQPSRQVRYLDHAATTPVAPEALDAMLPFFSNAYGNPSSLHSLGRRAGVALEAARRSIADRIGARPSEIIFTSGGTEGANAGLRGVALARRAATGANRIVTTPVEHKAVLATAEELRNRYGFALTLVPVDGEGRIDMDAFAASLGSGAEVAVVSIMYANNEVGTIQPIEAIASLCGACKVPIHTDAVQAAGKLPLDVERLQVDALSVAAHKFYGPKGAGFLYLRPGTPFWPQVTGGSHEAGRRGGTENVPLVVGMARAFELAETDRPTEYERQRALRDRLIGGVLATIDGARLTGSHAARLDNHASFLIPGAEAEGVLIGLDLAGIAASSGSACTSGAQRPSHVLEAMGITHPDASCALRFSLGRSNTVDDIDYLLTQLARIVGQVRG